jgi:hypothetical protein
MRSAIAKVITFLLCTACSLGPPAQPASVGVSEPFSLRVGESARTHDGALVIGFEGVPVDSRCPKGERCVWAGDATVRVWLQKAGGTRVTRELHTASSATRADVAEFQLRVVRLDPPAVSGKAIAQSDYIATLALGDDASAPER